MLEIVVSIAAGAINLSRASAEDWVTVFLICCG